MMKLKLRIILILVISLGLFGCAKQTPNAEVSTKPASTKQASTTPGAVKVILMAGQSNMEGAGDFDKISTQDLAKLKSTEGRISISGNGKPSVAVAYTQSKYKLEKYGFEKSFGPEVSLAIALGELYPEEEFLFIKTTKGGTSLYGAWSPDWTSEKAAAVERGTQKQTTPYYALHMQHTKDALGALKASGKNYDIVAALWLQGENDAGKEVAARSYEENLKRLIARFRLDTDSPDLPFVFGQINSTYGRFKEGPDMVREVMIDVANADENAAIILTTTNRSWPDFPKHSDNVHYNTEGQMRWGRAFAKELVALRAFE